MAWSIRDMAKEVTLNWYTARTNPAAKSPTTMVRREFAGALADTMNDMPTHNSRDHLSGHLRSTSTQAAGQRIRNGAT